MITIGPARREGPLSRAVFLVAALLTIWPLDVASHSGPPFPIVLNQAAGPYHVSVWTDPDATDDGSAGGQFWVMVRLLDGAPLPSDTRAVVTATPLDQAGPLRSGTTEPVKGTLTRQFVALLLDHEGRFAVRTQISGAAGSAVLDAEVDATYDLRPPPVMLVVYAMPFLAIGLFWLTRLRHRRTRTPPDASKAPRRS